MNWQQLIEDTSYYVILFLQVCLIGGIGYLRKKMKGREKTAHEQTQDITSTIKVEQKELKKDVYKLQICNKELPLNERLKAFDKYKALGGNSYIDKYVKENLKND